MPHLRKIAVQVLYWTGMAATTLTLGMVVAGTTGYLTIFYLARNF